MPDGGLLSGLTRATAPKKRYRPRWVSPLLRRILLVNALPLALLVVALLYLDQYQNGLLEAQVTALREQARVFAGALEDLDLQLPGTIAGLIGNFHLIAHAAQVHRIAQRHRIQAWVVGQDDVFDAEAREAL